MILVGVLFRVARGHSLFYGHKWFETLSATFTAFILSCAQLAAVNNPGGNVQIYTNMVLNTVETWNDANTTDSAQPSGPGTTIHGDISGIGGIQKTGPGTLRLRSTSNTYQGGTNIVAGIVEAQSSGSLGAASSPVQIDGGTLRLATYPLTQATFTLAQPVTLGAAGGTITTRYGSTSFDGGISGGGELRIEADQSWGTFLQSHYTMSGTNTYSGGTVVGAVTVNVIGTGQALGTGGVTLKNGAVLSLNAESNLAPGKKVALQPESVLVLNSTAINPANLLETDPAKTTGGTLSYTENLSTPINMGALGNGKLFLGSSGAVTYSASSLGAGSDGTYRVGNGSGGNVQPVVQPTLRFAGTPNLFTGARALIVGSEGPVLLSESKDVAVILKHANDYTGGTTLAGGILAIGHNAALGSGTLTITGGVLCSDGAPREIANPIVFNQPNGASFVFGGTANFDGSPALTLNGPVDLGGTSHEFIGRNSLTTFLKPISNGAVELLTGDWKFAAANSFAGGLTLDGATLDFSNDDQLGADGSTLALQGAELRPTTSVTIARPVTLTYFDSTFDVETGVLTLAGSVTATTSITKNGAGSLIFKDGGKTLSNITINGGLVRLDDTGTNGTAGVGVRIGGTLSGNGSVRSCTVSTGGHLAPGTEAPATFRIDNFLSLAAGSILDFDLGLSVFDKIILGGGSIEKRGSSPVQVNIADAGGLAPGQTFTLLDWTSASGSVSASNFQLGSGPVMGEFSVVGKTLRFTVAAVPEPGSLALVGIGALLLSVHRRRR